MENGNDLIRRQDTLEALRMCYETERIDYTNGNEYINYEQAVHEVEQLSFAQPEIIYCKDCKHYALRSLFGRSYGLCERLCNESHSILTESNDFCSHAERRNQ